MRILADCRPILLGFALLACSFGTSLAGDLKLSTIRVDLSDKQPSASLTITNAGAEKTLIQMRLWAWSQKDDADALTPTNDLIANPPIAELAPNGKQLVRIGYMGKHQMTAEQAYRLYVEEVPIIDKSGDAGIHTYLKIIMPVFIAATEKATAPALTAMWSQSAGGQPTLLVQNRRSEHMRITKYSFAGVNSGKNEFGGLHYVLAGAQIALPVDGVVGTPKSVSLTTTDGVLDLPLETLKQ